MYTYTIHAPRSKIYVTPAIIDKKKRKRKEKRERRIILSFKHVLSSGSSSYLYSMLMTTPETPVSELGGCAMPSNSSS